VLVVYLATAIDVQTSHNSVLAQAPSYPSIDSPSMFALPPTNKTSTTAPSNKHSKHSTKLQQQQAKANPAAMPGSVSVLGGSPMFTSIKPSEGTSHSSSVIIGNLVPLEPTTCSNDSIVNPSVALPLSHAGLLPPFSEIAMELNGKTVMMSRDITAVTNAIGGPIPAMSPVVSGHNVVR